MQARGRRFELWQQCGGLSLLVALSGCAADDAPATQPGSAGSSVGGNSAGGGATATGGVSGGAPTGGSSGMGGTVSAGGNISTGGAPPAGGSGAGGQSDGGSSAGGSGGAGVAGTMAGGGGSSGAGAGGAGAGAGNSGSGGSVTDATIVPDPGWACGMEDGIPPPTKGELAFTITLNIQAEHDVGKTPYGQRRLLDVSGGTITGERLEGTVLTGGLEYELTLDNGVVEYQGINVLNTSAGRIFVRSCGVARDENSAARIIPDFEATMSGGNAFLNTGKWVATREVTSGKMKLDVYDAGPG